MDTQPETTTSSFVYNRLPTKVSRKAFNRYIEPHLYRPKKGPKPKLSLFKIFNYILYVLHTGMQWEQLKTNRTDFSVVLFRSDFVLFSEKNHVKVPKNQWVWAMPYHLERLSGATSRGQITAPEVQKPSQ